MNPVSHAEEEREQEVTELRTEVAKLRERIKVLQEGERDDVTCKVDKRLASTNLQEVQGMHYCIILLFGNFLFTLTFIRF